MSQKFSFADLFAGAGGFSIGMTRAGLRDSYAVELDAWACETLRANFTSMIIERDIRTISDGEISSLPRVDVIVGGPPCQGFSVAGPSQYGVEDPRNNLFMHFLRFVELKMPDICIIENVPQLLTKSIAHGVTAAKVICQSFAELGFATQAFVLNAADFGVPQSRKRAFIVATNPRISFSEPKNTHAEATFMDSLFPSELSPYVTVWEAISDLPEIDSGEGSDELSQYCSTPKNAYQEALRKGSAGVMNHIAMKHTARLIERFKQIQHGKSLKDVNASNGQIRYRSGEVNDRPYKSNNQRLDPHQPSLAIPASFQSNFLHPSRHRNLTAREAARLMSFPDSFVFRGKRTAMSWEKHLSQYNQIGNAVCPLVAEALGRSCIEALDSSSTEHLTHQPRLKERPIRITTRMHSSEVHDERLIAPDANILRRLGDGARKLLKGRYRFVDEFINYHGFKIPLYYFSAAILFITEESCLVCRDDLPPFRKHSKSMPFLISKDEFSSLRATEKDHGLDFHLRALDLCRHQVGHFVGEILAGEGLAVETDIVNERTGRTVRGISIEAVPKSIEQLRNPLRDIIAQPGKIPPESPQTRWTSTRL
jgi:DNA (cytosine-5)-methyltransferase 1